MKPDILHYPRLDTVMMVESTIKKLKYYPTKTELWKALPKKGHVSDILHDNRLPY